MRATLKAIFALSIATAMLLSSTTFAAEVPGKVFYKMPSGEMVSRDVHLDVPARGQGKVIFKSAHHTIESHAFKTKKVHGRTIFSVLFLDPPGAPAKTAMVLTGTYLRGTNYVVYYGDIYSKSYADEKPSQESGEQMLDHVLQLNDGSHGEHAGDDWNFSGGFKFGKSLTAD